MVGSEMRRRLYNVVFDNNWLNIVMSQVWLCCFVFSLLSVIFFFFAVFCRCIFYFLNLMILNFSQSKIRRLGSSGNMSLGNTLILIVQQSRKCYCSVDKKRWQASIIYICVIFVSEYGETWEYKNPRKRITAVTLGNRVGETTPGGEWERGFSWEV